ncbi:MAG: hypothetical protein WC213_00180 [Arenimonas sp.]|jgi:hypothetical protein
MSRDSYEIREGEKLWPLVQMVRNTHYDDLTPDRVQQLVEMVDGWRITDAEGKRIDRGASRLLLQDRG